MKYCEKAAMLLLLSLLALGLLTMSQTLNPKLDNRFIVFLHSSVG